MAFFLLSFVYNPGLLWRLVLIQWDSRRPLALSPTGRPHEGGGITSGEVSARFINDRDMRRADPGTWTVVTLVVSIHVEFQVGIQLLSRYGLDRNGFKHFRIHRDWWLLLVVS